VVQEFAEGGGYTVVDASSVADITARVSRAYPAALVIDGSDPSDEALGLCRQIKRDTFTAVVPVIIYVDTGDGETAPAAFQAGADEVLSRALSERERALRLGLALRRAERDVSVHPSTRLPGTVQIERDFADRLLRGQKFAVCYADLDHFKEFNDRYGYHQGDGVIMLTSRILRDVVRAHAPDGFVGHIGGDDFIFSVPLEAMTACCEDILDIFDTLSPLQYTEEDQAKGFFIGKDRRGNTYEVPLMSLSIGVVTNENRTLVHTAEISALATEMKSFAKTFAGSLYLVDRRTGTDRTAGPATDD
jgi:GGDEF domain-containing protein